MYAERITQSVLFDKIKYDLNRNLYGLQKAQNVVSTGKRVNRPSDDPISVVQIMKRKVDINRTDRYIKNTENAKELLNQDSSVLVEVSRQIDRAREIALAFANDPTKSSGTSNSAKVEVENILRRAINLANSKENGRYIFAGTKTLTKPFEANETISEITYRGDMGEIKRQISPNATMTANVPGVAIFSDGVFQALVRLSDALDTERPRNELIADTALTTSEISANFTTGGSPADETTVVNDLDQVTTVLSDGDTITVSGKDSQGFVVNETFIYGADDDGTTLGDLTGKIEEAYNAYGNSTVTINNNGDIMLDFAAGPMSAPELTIKFTDEDAISFTLSEFNNIEINKLDQVTDLSDGDTITISGVDSDGAAVNTTFTYGAGSDGITLSDLLTTIDNAYENSTVTIDDNGYIMLTPEEDNSDTPSLSLIFTDVDEDGSAITLPQFSDKMRDSINKLDEALNKVSEFQADIGSKINRLEDTRNMLEDVKLNLESLLSQEEDANIADAITEFITKQTVYQAALNSAIQMMQPSLIEFLS